MTRMPSASLGADSVSPTPVGPDGKGESAIDYGVAAIPEKYLISREGILLKKLVGPTNAGSLRKVLNGLLLSDASGSGSSGSGSNTP